MPEIKNTFLQGKMNKDLDERLIPNGQYRHAENVEVSTSEGSDVGTVKNILGNQRVDSLGIGSDFKCVGSIADEKNNKLYWFITKYNVDAILEYDADNDIAKYVLVDIHAGTSKAALKFFGNVITGINIIDNLLFWTDNYGEPKKINIDTCKAGTTGIDTHTKLSFENGSFHGLTLQNVSNSLNNNFLEFTPRKGKYIWYNAKQAEKMLGIAEFTTSSETHLIRHYRNGKFLEKRLAKFFALGSGNGTSGRYNYGGDDDFHVGDILYGDDVKIDIEERHITVIKPKPLNAPTVKINHSESAKSTSKIPNLFETKFPRFSYRYKYTDGEYSTFAPFTEPVFNAKYTKDTSKSTDGGVMYNQDTAYDIKEPYNKAMVNAIHSVDLTDFVTAQTPEDVVEIDILYKQENSSVIYSIETIKHIDPEWHTTGNSEGHNIGYNKDHNGENYSAPAIAVVDGAGVEFPPRGGYTQGKYVVTTENIYAALPANQLLRPWDNVPRKALAQEVTGNRIVYGNYLQNYDIGSKAQVQVSYSDRQNRLGTFTSKGLPSIKSQRNYQLGVVYCDKYGRETPVFTSNGGAVNIPWQDSSGNNNASKSTQLTVGAINNFPEWVDSLKFFVKETSNEYYNLTMDRAWVTKSTYALDNSEGHLWISFPSSDRNKISEEDYIILKKKIGVGEEQVTFENKFKVVDIKNEAPDAIKYDLVNQGVAQNKSNGTDNFFTGGSGHLFTNSDYRIDKEVDSIHIEHDSWKGAPGTHPGTGYRIPLEDVDSGVDADEMPLKTKGLYMSWRVEDDGNGNEQSSSRYKIVGGTKFTSAYILNLERKITAEDAALAANLTTLKTDLLFQIEKKELKDNENFSGKFFVKISKNQVSSIIETGKEVSNLDKYQVTAKQGVWFWHDDIYPPQGSPMVGDSEYGLTNFYGYDAGHSSSNHIQHNYTDLNGNNNTSADISYGALKISDWHGVWGGILNELDNKPRFFVDAMHMIAGQSESSDYAKYSCVTWSGADENTDVSHFPTSSSWSYPPLKTWLSEFGDTTNLTVPSTTIAGNTINTPFGGSLTLPDITVPSQAVWYENNLLSTSPLMSADADYEDLKIDGWVGPLQNVSRYGYLSSGGGPNLYRATKVHVNGLEGLVTTNEFHATGPRRWFSGLNGTDYGVGEDTRTYSDNGEEDRHFMHLSFFAPGKDLHDADWTHGDGLAGPALYGSTAWMAHLQGIWGGGVFTGEAPDQTFGTTDDHTHLAMEGNYDGSDNYLPESPGPGVGFGYDLDYRELHERQWDPTFLHKSDGTYAGDPGNTIRDFIRNLYPGSKFRFNRTKHGVQDAVLDDAVYTIKKVTVKKLYNHTSWRKPYNRYIDGEGYDIETTQHLAYQSVEEVALDYLGLCDDQGAETVASQDDDLKAKIEQFGASHNRRLCYIIELDKNPHYAEGNQMGSPLDMDNGGHNGMSGELAADNYTDVEFLDPVQDLLLSDLSKFPAIWEVDPKKQDVDLDIYYEASNNIPVRINERTNELFAPVGCKVEIINATPQQALNDVYLESWYGSEATFSPGFNRADGNNEIDYTNTAFKFIRENGSYTVAEAGGQQLIGALTGIKSKFIFKEDIGSVIGVGLAWYNCFSFGNGLESNRIRDDFNEMFISNGVKASTTTQQAYEEERRSHGLIYSGIYNSNSGINDLNQFIMAEKITKDLNPTYGSIQKLFQRRISLIAFCEDRVIQITSNKDAIYNADGNPQLISSNNVLGDANPFVGNFGISKNPESFASESYRAYFTDKARGAVIRLSKDGLTPISKAGMHDWFRDNLPIYTSLIGTYDSYKENYNITLSNTYTENIMFNEAFGQGVGSSPIEVTNLNVIEDGIIGSGDSYVTSLSTSNFPDDSIFSFGNSNPMFTNTVTVTNHPAISFNEFQVSNIVPGEIYAEANIDIDYAPWEAAIYETTPGSDDGWWYDPDFEDWGYQIWSNDGSTTPNYWFDGQVRSNIFRKINGATLTGALVSPHTGGWPIHYNPNNGGKKIAYPAFSSQVARPTWVSQCVTRNTGGAGGTDHAITFDRCNPSNSYVEFRGIGGAGAFQSGATHPSLFDYNDAPGTPGDADHSSFFNGDELFIQFELTLFKTYTGNSTNSYGYNWIIPRIQLFDGTTAVDTLDVLVTTTTLQALQSTQNDYAYLQNSPDSYGNLGNDFVYESSEGTKYQNGFTNGPSDVDYACVKYWPDGNGVHAFPDTYAAGNFNTAGNPAGATSSANLGTLKIICGMCVKFRDPNQQNSDGTPIVSGANIEEVKVVNDLRIRIDNAKPAATSLYNSSGYSANEFNNSGNTIYPFRQQLWEINNLKIKKGFGVVAPHVDEVQEVITFDDLSTGAVEQYTESGGNLFDENGSLLPNAEFVNGQWILNQGDIVAALVGGSNYQVDIPGYDIPAWVEVNHSSTNEWEGAISVGTGNGYNTNGSAKWITSKKGSWFGSNHIGSDASDGGYTWRVPPATYYNAAGNVSTPQTWPFNANGLTLGENSFTAQGSGTAGNPEEKIYDDVISDYLRVQQPQVTNTSSSAYPIHCVLSSGNEYVVGDWYFIDIEYADNASDNGNKNPLDAPNVGSYSSGGALHDGGVYIPGVANYTSGGAIVNENGVGVMGGSGSFAHVFLVPTWRDSSTEYGDSRWVLRAIYQVDPNSYAVNHLDYFSLRFYNFKNHKIYVTKIISKKINYTNGTGTATNWDINYNPIPGTYDQLHTFSDGVYNSSTDDYSNVYYHSQKLCWENAYADSTWSQNFQNVIPTTLSTTPAQDPNWTLKFTVGPNPKLSTNALTGALKLRVTNSFGDNNVQGAGHFDGMKTSGITDTGTYEITFGMNGAEDGDSDWTIYKDGSTTQYNATLEVYPNATDNAAKESQIAFYNNDPSVALSANVSGITLTNQTQLFEGGTVASWNFDGFEPTIDDYIIWDGDNSTDGRIQFQNCPIIDPNSTTGITEIITANQLIDKPINRYEKYEVSFTYKMADIVDNPGSGLLHMYYFNNEGYGFRIGDIGDLSNPYTSGIMNSSTDEGDGIRKVTKIVEIGSSEAASELAGQGVEALLNTFVIRRDASDSDNVTGWVDNISMKRHYNIELNDDGTLVYPETTVTFSEDVNGWTSFKSFIPEAGLSLSKKYFTLKDAALYQHYVPANNATAETAENYNTFYGDFKESTITAVLNAEPSVVKTFNVLNYEGSQAHVTKPLTATDQFGNSTITINNAKAWSSGSNIDGWKVTEIKTDMDNGNLRDFIKKEGKWFGYIKGKHVTTDVLDTSRFSVQGIGFANAITNDI